MQSIEWTLNICLGVENHCVIGSANQSPIIETQNASSFSNDLNITLTNWLLYTIFYHLSYWFGGLLSIFDS